MTKISHGLLKLLGGSWKIAPYIWAKFDPAVKAHFFRFYPQFQTPNRE
ncbi:MAG: hypothetical protein WBM32_03335 [Crocosphaera sp.]